MADDPPCQSCRAGPNAVGRPRRLLGPRLRDPSRRIRRRRPNAIMPYKPGSAELPIRSADRGGPGTPLPGAIGPVGYDVKK